MIKTKIAILFSGEVRENGLGYNTITELPKYLKENYLHDILESYEKNFFTSEFKNNVEYDIFISTDNINIEKTLDFFGKENVKNIFLYNTDYYLHNIKSNLPSVHHYINRLYEITDNKYIRYPTGILQYHKMASCFEMLTNYTNVENYDYIIRSRLDTVYEHDIFNYIKELNNNPQCLYVGNDDQFGIGRPDIMKVYFNLINNFGTYHTHHLRDNFKDSIVDINTWKSHLIDIDIAITWRYASLQLSESLYQYCDNNNLDIDTSLKWKLYGYIRRHIKRVKPQP
jgi:hypothetical protein